MQLLTRIINKLKWLWSSASSQSFGRDIIVISVARILVVVLQLGYVKLYTTSLSNYSLGVYALWSTISYILNAALFVPIDYYQQAKIYPLRSQGKSLMGLVYFNISVFKWVGLISAVAVITAISFEQSLGLYISAAIALSVTTYATIALRGLLNNLEHKKIVALVQPLEALGKIFIFLLLIYLTGATALQMIGSQIASLLGSIVLMVWLCWRMKIFSQKNSEIINVGEIIRYCYPISIGALINLLQLQGYRLLLAPMGFMDMIGVYFGTTQVGIAGMSLFSLIFVQMFLPTLYKTSGSYMRNYLRNSLLLICGVLLFSAVFSRQLVMLVTKPEFGEHSLLILYGVIAEGGNLLIGGLSVYMTIKGKTGQMLWGSALTAVVSLVSTIAFYLMDAINLYTVGLPIVFSQAIAVVYLYRVYIKTEAQQGS